MNLKESFRYQKFLDGLMQRSQNSLIDRNHALMVTKTHLRNRVNSEAEDKVEDVDFGEFIPNNDVLSFMLYLVGEKEKLSCAIGRAKAACGFDMDAAVETNKNRQTLRRSVEAMLKYTAAKRTERGSDYKFNVEGNQTQQTVSANTVHRYLANISKCLNSAVKQNIIAFNPVTRIDKPKKTRYTGAKFYNEKQINELLSRSKGDPLEIAILLTAFYGLRRSEVLGLKWSAISFEDGTIAIQHTVVPGTKKLHEKDSTKNESSYDIIPMAKIIKERLSKWKRQQWENRLHQPNDYIVNDYVCTQADGSLIKPNFISQHFQILLKNIGMPPIRFHDLRHSSASYLLSLGFSLKEIQVWLRHKDIQTSMNLYTHIDMDGKREIADSLNEKLLKFSS